MFVDFRMYLKKDFYLYLKLNVDYLSFNYTKPNNPI